MDKHGLNAAEEKVWALLSHASRPLSAYDILAKLRVKGVRSPPTVYRALEALVARGLAHRLESLSAFVACRHGEAGRHRPCGSFAICTACGGVEELDLPAARRVAARFLAEVEREVREVRGLCHACAHHQKGKKGDGDACVK